MTKILFLTPYPLNSAPSQRFRFEQYFSYLSNNNIVIHTAPFLDKNTWKIFYQKGYLLQKVLGILKGLINRHLLLLKIHQYDKIFIHREACMIGPAYFEWMYAKIFKKKLIFDFDDAIWLKDVSDANENLSWLKFPNKTKSIIKHASFVVAGNKHLANYALQFNKNVTVIPTTIDTSYHQPPILKKSTDTITIGWTGSLTTNKHFELLKNVLTTITTKFPQVEIIMISNVAIYSNDFKIKFVKWNQKTEIEDLSQIDIGIMPLPDDEWAKGKCGFKGLQYMALEVPTIMSPVGVNTEIIQDGVNGFLASTEEEWLSKLGLFIQSEELRKKLGKAGRQTIIERYSIEANKDKYLALLSN
ncbi:MAG TPA: glycosyltransferase family 4 protein [Vicingaceae bacterium]|nr:glycosyltransferase family 4 protein [Vicingaceae bacterium]